MCGGNSTVGSNPTGTATGPFVFLTSTVCETRPKRRTPGFGRGFFSFLLDLRQREASSKRVLRCWGGGWRRSPLFSGALKRPGRPGGVFGHVGASGVLVVLVEFGWRVPAYVRGIGTSFTGSGLRL